jgi:hypothetical protein
MPGPAKLRKLAKECRTQARVIKNCPGLVGFGAREKPIIDLYHKIGDALDEIADALSNRSKP